MQEREVKLSADDAFELPDLDGCVKGIVAGPREPERLSTVYIDTEDRRLARWGLSFRHRVGQGWTVKLPSNGSGALLVRDECVFPGSARQPPTAAVDLVRAYTRDAELRPQIRLRTLRRGVRLLDAQGTLVADVVDDAVSLVAGRRVVGGFREIEVETTPSTPPGLLDAIVKRLRAAGAGTPDPTPKYLRALGGADAAPPEVELAAVPADASLEAVVTHAIAAGVVRLLRHDPVVRLDTDIEGVHQARVATRRLRSDLRTFRSVVDPQWANPLRAELGWLGGELGKARDADVLLERLREPVRSLPEASSAGGAAVIAALERRRAEAHDEVLAALRGERYVALLDALIAAAQAPGLAPGVGKRPAVKALKPIVARSWRKLDRLAGSLTAEAPDERLHMVRILAKRSRYAAEACAPTLGKRTRRFATRARALQDVLGELNDAVVAERWLREFAAASGDVQAAFAAGGLAERERLAARRARRHWRRAYTRVSRAAV